MKLTDMKSTALKSATQIQNTSKKNVIVYGLGRSGLAVARHVARLGWAGIWFDKNNAPHGANEAEALGLERAMTLPKNLKDFDMAIVAPGVMMHHPDVVQFKNTGLEVIGEVELCYRTVDVPTIGVTGTAGKGSTTTLIAKLLRGQGLDAREGGNFDPPLLDAVQNSDVVVVELSSFQLERIVNYHPGVAVITNIGIDHITDHGSVEAYHNAKWKLVENLEKQDVLVVTEHLEMKRPTKASILRLPETGDVQLNAETILKEQDFPQTHPHNVRLAIAATLAHLQRIGKNPDLARFAHDVKNFSGVPGRFETVAEISGTRFIEDSIATRTLAVAAALTLAPAPIAWIVGGVDKGAELLPLVALAKEKVVCIFGIGQDGEKFANYFAKHGIETRIIAEPNGQLALNKAVQAGFEVAKNGSVLLAPLGTSFDQFKDYKARGAAFKNAVKDLQNKTLEEHS